MFALFAQHYRDIHRFNFERDLDAKDHVLLLRDEEDLVGFTTIEVEKFVFQGRALTVIFSGDTIVDPAYWGEQELARAWLGLVGGLSRQSGAGDLYWFLIVKGHRTYRYLPAFALDFVPAPSGRNDPDLLALRDALARHRFAEGYDAGSGIIHFDEARGSLTQQLAEPSERELALPEVRFFLEANPGFRAGDELACLCSLSPENMRPRARRWFEAGRDAP